MGIGSARFSRSVDSAESLTEFIESRASHVAQTALYGYLKTRSGTRFPQLFEHPEFLRSINIAKWQVWVACVADLAVYAGGLLSARGATDGRVEEVMQAAIGEIFDRAGSPDEAGGDYAASVDAARERIAACVWSSVVDDESAFSQSPAALVRWAPVVDELKRFDEEIVRNSVRFRWIDVRRRLRRVLDASFVLD